MKNAYKKFFALFTLLAVVTAPFLSHAFGLGKELGLNAKADVKAEARFGDESEKTHQDDNEDWEEDWKDNEDLPKGIRIAPGIEKRVEEGKGLPWGIFKKFWNGDHDPDDNEQENEDSTKIELNNLKVATTSETAVLSFSTNLETKGSLTYSESEDLEDSPKEVSISLENEHSLEIEGLNSETKYYYKIELEDEDEELDYESKVHAFTTKSEDVEEPSLSVFNTFAVGTNSAYVVWFTTEDSDSKVWVSTESDVDTNVNATVVEDELVHVHVVKLTNLESDTKYYVKASSTDSSGNVGESETISFTTDAE